MAKLLVTGANGQLGSEIKQLADKYIDFKIIYTDVDTLDITEYNEIKSLIEKEHVDYIINCAAYTNVDRAEEDYENAVKINVDAVSNLRRGSEEFGCKIIHVSTDYVFDSSPQNVPFKEDDKTFAESAYGSTKLRGELALQQSDNYMIIRTSWLYSTFGHNFVKTMLRLGRERAELGVIFDQVGTPTYAADLALAILEIVSYFEKNGFKKGIYHYSNEGVCSWYDFATEIMRLANLNCKVKPIETKDYPLPAKRPAYSVMNKNKIKANFGLEIPHWMYSLQKCMEKL
ncbi:MAG: dTDP-4-dehydrorhamnose reductase [Chloroflexia bacterium]|nr:dTDP-4-dehydrorhamnose reductase [Chloroflexia bacterium]